MLVSSTRTRVVNKIVVDIKVLRLVIGTIRAIHNRCVVKRTQKH